MPENNLRHLPAITIEEKNVLKPRKGFKVQMFLRRVEAGYRLFNDRDSLFIRIYGQEMHVFTTHDSTYRVIDYFVFLDNLDMTISSSLKPMLLGIILKNLDIAKQTEVLNIYEAERIMNWDFSKDPK